MTMDKASCIELAIDAENRCRAGDLTAGIKLFKDALKVGTENLDTLSAIYSQMGNAYFYMEQYESAFEYHRLDIELTRNMDNKLKEAEASGNLGNTLKMLGRYEEALACCQHHLDLSREVQNKVNESRALYNMGFIHYVQGKHWLRESKQELTPVIENSFRLAVQRYNENRKLVQELNDRVAEGRVCGNLGNACYMLGDVDKGIEYHLLRLDFAKEFGDLYAERRAHSNLGNGHTLKKLYPEAISHYRRALELALELMDRALEAQSCYSLGAALNMMGDFTAAIPYLERHLSMAREIGDKLGEARACLSLAKAQIGGGISLMRKHLHVPKELPEDFESITAHAVLEEVSRRMGIDPELPEPPSPDESFSSNRQVSAMTACSTPGPSSDHVVACSQSAVSPRARPSMERMQLLDLSPEVNQPAVASSQQPGSGPGPGATPTAPAANRTRSGPAQGRVAGGVGGSGDGLGAGEQQSPDRSRHNSSLDENGFFDLLTHCQGRRMDEQRCSFTLLPRQENSRASPSKDHLLDMVARLQRDQIHEQRCALVAFPGLRNPDAALQPARAGTASTTANRGGDHSKLNGPSVQVGIGAQAVGGGEDGACAGATAGTPRGSRHGSRDPFDDVLDNIIRTQPPRLEEQRGPRSSPRQQQAPTLPDEDFLTLLQRLQSSRMDEQRAELIRPNHNNNINNNINDREDHDNENPRDDS